MAPAHCIHQKTGLGRRSSSLVQDVQTCPRRAGQHDPSITVLLHRSVRRLTHVKRSTQMDGENLVDLVGRQILEEVVPQESGIVNKHVDAAKAVKRRDRPAPCPPWVLATDSYEAMASPRTP